MMNTNFMQYTIIQHKIKYYTLHNQYQTKNIKVSDYICVYIVYILYLYNI